MAGRSSRRLGARKPDRRYTAQDDALIRAMRAEGRHWAEIGRTFGVHGTSIRQRLVRVLQEDDPHPDAELLRAEARRRLAAEQATTAGRRPLALRTRDGAFSVAALQILQQQRAATAAHVRATMQEIAAWARTNRLPPACRDTLAHINAWRTREGLPPFMLQQEKTP
ncbi:hypothetical protein [Gluconacetobacter entanii]|uniref:Uncharacterized protein n=1 Tax=Gluconacetobacter entanii TaxID=108528 RepID=A0A318PPW3_9PROT|nr:hypothetical protein [Gluconacetobacter entanii]MCE2578094.1 hypothetical protein [Komagataeibacter sp. FNDCR1]PYD62289.1 hypothetical protein CFR72_13370 [Gluconacetobacter entanii]